MLRSLSIVVGVAWLGVGCSGRTSGAGAGSGSASGAGGTVAAFGVDGWWEVPDVKGADDLAGGAMKLGPKELIAVAKDGRVFVRGCTTTVTGAAVSTHDCGPVLTGTIEGDKVVYPTFTITRATKARAEELDKLAAAKRPAGDICERAVRCLHAFDPAADAKEEAFQLGGPAPYDPTTCQQYLGAMGSMAAEGKLPKPLPPECT